MADGISLTSSAADDGTHIELFKVDLQKLMLNLHDQDTDHDNAAEISRTVDSLDLKGALLAWNGPFFAYDFSAGKQIARHIGPVVQNGVVRHNVGNHRWTLGWRKNQFRLLHMPTKDELARERFDFAVAGVQALIKDRQPLALQPFPKFKSGIKNGPQASTAEEAGHIPMVDHMRTSRTSLGWNESGTSLYVLIVSEPDHELGSKLGLKRGEAQAGGWTLSDIQRFWLSFGAFTAINSDGGDVTQRVFYRSGKPAILPPRNRQGTLMSFYITQK